MHREPAPASLDKRLKREGWSLRERISWAGSNGQSRKIDARTETMLERWRQVVAPEHADNFDKRLEWDGLTPEGAAWALDPDLDSTPDQPEWWPLLSSIREAASSSDHALGLETRCDSEPFVHIWRPVAGWALKSLQARCHDLEARLEIAAEAWLDLAEALLERLCNTTDQALWEQFNQRRAPGQMLIAHLGLEREGDGGPLNEIYNAFVDEQRSSGYGLLLQDFPVLGRLLSVVTGLWLDSSEEMLRRLADTRQALRDHFEIGRGFELRKVQLGLSDPHRGGRAVAVLSFGEAQGRRINVVYKPKDMHVDATYQRYLETLNLGSSQPPLRTLKVLTCEGYGFMEWVEHRTCTSDDELERFYRNAGRTMAILHLLGCTDCHHENLIASGDQLLLIDTETLLEADLQDLVSEDGGNTARQSDLQASVEGSVLRSGLLPQWLMVGGGKKKAFDISALGIQPPPLERRIPGWLGINSDGMIAGQRLVPCTSPTSLPVKAGSNQRLTDFTDQLCSGFSDQLQEAIDSREKLLRELNQFREQPRRLVARATRLYFAIQRQMLEPAALRSAVAHGLKLEQLSRSYLIGSKKPDNWVMFQAELKQMERLDIPFFVHLINETTLPMPEGLPAIPDFMKASGLKAAIDRLEKLDGGEILFQEQLVRGAIAARHLKPETRPLTKSVERTRDDNDSPKRAAENAQNTQETYRQEAFRIGEELWATAIHDRRGRTEWLGMDLAADGEAFYFGLIGPTLYGGTSGIGLLFARLAQASTDPTIATLWRDRAWSCFEKLAEMASKDERGELFRLVRDLPAGLSGVGGLIMGLVLMKQAGFETAGALAEHLMRLLRIERLKTAQTFDLIGGIAGLIGPLLLLKNAEALRLAAICGERLLEVQRETGGWPSDLERGTRQRAALTGMSHGAAGILAALARLSEATGGEHFAEGARQGVAYERSVVDRMRGNWPDFRRSDEPTSFMHSWCHGAPGILLSRHILQAAGLGDATTSEELTMARLSTIAWLEQLEKAEALDGQSNLCCGVFGLTGLLRIDAQLRQTEVSTWVTGLESQVMNQARKKGSYNYFSVDSGPLNLPGLFSGKAGVALALMEAMDGQRWMLPILSCGLLEAG